MCGFAPENSHRRVDTTTLDARVCLVEGLAGCQQSIAGDPVCACCSLQAVAAGQTARPVHAHSCLSARDDQKEGPAPAALFPAKCAQRLTAVWLYLLQLATQQRLALQDASRVWLHACSLQISSALSCRVPTRPSCIPAGQSPRGTQPSSVLSTWCVQESPVNQVLQSEGAQSHASKSC